MGWNWGSAGSGAATGAAVGGPWGAVAGGLLGGFFGGGGDDMHKDADKYLDQIPGELRKYLMPYVNQGQTSMGKVGSEYDKLLADPNALIQRLGAGYQQSPGYQWRLGQGENAINNAQAAGGMAGTGQHQQMAGELAGNLANQDYQQYLQQALGLYGTGLQGHQGLTDLGANASGSLASGISNALMMRGGLGYQQGMNKNQQNSELMSGLLSYFGKK